LFLDLGSFDFREVNSRETFRFATDCAPAALHRARARADGLHGGTIGREMRSPSPRPGKRAIHPRH
jgi:hypothetical protein